MEVYGSYGDTHPVWFPTRSAAYAGSMSVRLTKPVVVTSQLIIVRGTYVFAIITCP